MRRVLLVLLILALALALAAGAAALLFFALRSGMKGSVPSRVVLELDLEAPIEEWTPPDPFTEALQKRRMTVRDVIEALEKAKDDERVQGLVARVGAAPLGMGRIRSAMPSGDSGTRASPPSRTRRPSGSGRG
jgi:protease-4